MEYTPFHTTRKLVESHLSVKDILCTLSTLQFYVTMGGTIDTVHDKYELSQKSYLRSFVDGYLEVRSKTKNNIKARSFKMISNSAFGWTVMDSVKHSVKTEMVIARAALRRRVHVPLFRRVILLKGDRALVVSGRRRIYVSQPSFIVYQILELCKLEIRVLLQYHTKGLRCWQCVLHIWWHRFCRHKHIQCSRYQWILISHS